jgi:PAS domain S-box-containing protein
MTAAKTHKPASTAGASNDLDWLAPLAADMAGLGYWHYDARTQRFTWSKQMYNIYGLDPATEPLSLSELADAAHPEDRERLLHHRVVNRGADAEICTRILRPNGEVRHIIARSTVRLDEAGEVLERFGTLIDVTDAKVAEAAARESEKRYRFMAEYVPDMIAHSTPEAEALYISPSCTRITGFTPEEQVNINPLTRVHPDDAQHVADAFGKLLSERLPRLPEPLRYRYKHRDGHWVWLEANPIPIYDEKGALKEFIDVVRNVDQTVAFEAELAEAKARAESAAAAKAAFLANMSHELRTPLTSIIGFSHLLVDRDDLADEAQHCVRRIADASEALLAIINDVLDFSKLEAGQVALEQQPFSPRRLIEDAAGLLAIQAAAKGVEVRTDVAAKLPQMVSGDGARLRQVLLNLLSNAVKFTGEGSVTVRAGWRGGRGGPRMRISVIDTGEGIPPEHLERLFQRFSQAELSINRTHGGTGLGLAISKGIIELMGGQIGVETELGKGSTFWFEVPAEPAADQARAAHEVAALELPALRLLVVDDTAVNRELVKLMLLPLGVEVEEAAGGAEGVEAAARTPFDLILMDVRMPGVDGLEAARRIRAGEGPNRSKPILALTADVQPENVSACRAAGMDAVLAKPIVPQKLLSEIGRWTGEGERRADQDAA